MANHRLKLPLIVLTDAWERLLGVVRFASIIGVVVWATALSPAFSASLLTPPTYVGQFAAGSFWEPNGIAIDPNGNVYVLDLVNYVADGRVQKFDFSGNLLFAIGTAGNPFYYPWGIATDQAGNLYVADSYNNRVRKFDGNGVWISDLYGSPGAAFYNPRMVAVDSHGNLYVTELQNYRVQKFDSNGAFLAKWGTYGTGPGQFNFPAGIAVDSNDNVYVADSHNNRIQKFDSNGTFLAQWGGPGPLPNHGNGEGQFYNPNGVYVDAANRVYVADTNNNRVQVFDTTGTFLTQWGTAGSNPGQMIEPLDIAVDEAGTIYVADLGDPNIAPPLPTGHVQMFLYPDAMLVALLKEVTNVGPGQSLANKVKMAQTYYAVPDIQTTCSVLTEFVKEVRAQNGKKIGQALDAKLIADASAIEVAIGCE